MHLNIKKNVTFDIPNPEPAGENTIFATLGIDEKGPRYILCHIGSDLASDKNEFSQKSELSMLK